MKLAELLIERAELQRRIIQTSARLKQFAVVQEGDEPAVKPETLISKLYSLHDQLEGVIVKINHANNSTEFAPGVSLADAIVTREILKSKRSVFESLSKVAEIQQNRYSRNEIRFVTTIDVENAITATDDLSKALRIIDSKIQAKNWEVEVS